MGVWDQKQTKDDFAVTPSPRPQELRWRWIDHGCLRSRKVGIQASSAKSKTAELIRDGPVGRAGQRLAAQAEGFQGFHASRMGPLRSQRTILSKGFGVRRTRFKPWLGH